jgi:nitrogenase molybdenum-iron protein beta chain
MAGTSSFTEGASVFGGQANLIQAIDNIFTIYNPQVIAVHTTCLSETIGDDISQITAKARESGKIPEGKYVFYASTPSYVGSHVTGFASMTKAMVDHFAEKSEKKRRQVNIIPGYVEPSDMEEIKRIAKLMDVPVVVFPDTSNVLNGPQTGKYEMFPKGGVTIDQLKTTGDSMGTLGLGQTGIRTGSPCIGYQMQSAMPGNGSTHRHQSHGSFR